jgi:hypothetical protein
MLALTMLMWPPATIAEPAPPAGRPTEVDPTGVDNADRWGL